MSTSTMGVLLSMANELSLSIEEMPIDDAKKMIRLQDKTLRLILKGDEGLIELYDWLEGNKEISYEDALLFLFDYLNIQQ